MAFDVWLAHGGGAAPSPQPEQTDFLKVTQAPIAHTTIARTRLSLFRFCVASGCKHPFTVLWWMGPSMITAIGCNRMFSMMMYFVVPSAPGGFCSFQPCFGATKSALLWPMHWACHDRPFKGHPFAYPHQVLHILA